MKKVNLPVAAKVKPAKNPRQPTDAKPSHALKARLQRLRDL